MPIRWAIADTLAPGSNASATACALNSFDARHAVAVEPPQVARQPLQSYGRFWFQN